VHDRIRCRGLRSGGGAVRARDPRTARGLLASEAAAAVGVPPTQRRGPAPPHHVRCLPPRPRRAPRRRHVRGPRVPRRKHLLSALCFAVVPLSANALPLFGNLPASFSFLSVALIAACRKVHTGFQLRAPGATAGFQVHSPFATNFISITLLVHCVGTGCSEPSAAGFGVSDRPGGDQHKRFPDSALGSPSPGQEVRGTASLATFIHSFRLNLIYLSSLAAEIGSSRPDNLMERQCTRTGLLGRLL